MKAIEVNNLVKSYGNVIAVNNISFSVERGSICAILGPNGSGKTTTIKSICNLLIPERGEIKLEGKDNKIATNKISALFEGTRNLYWRLTPRENLRYFAGIRGYGGNEIEKKANELLDRFNLGQKKDVIVNNLSRGMQQKVAIAMTLICDTDIVILDEPTLGLDVESIMEIKTVLMDIAREMHKTVLLSTHDMSLVQDVCDDVIVLNKGRIVAQDSLLNLMDMFKGMTYEFVLLNKLTDDKKKVLNELEYDFYFTREDSVVEVGIFDIKEIYNITDKLLKEQILIKEVKQKDINFERVYLNLINEGK